MVQRAIGVTVGALVTLALLAIFGGDTIQDNVVPVAVGAIAAFFWPIVIAWFLARRARDRRNDQIESEVQRQLDQQRRGPG
jgi:preprotein translocase subunit SecF